MTQRERTDEIAREAADAARLAAAEAHTPEARVFLRRHAVLLERLAGRRRAAERAAERAARGLALSPLGFWPLDGGLY
jgi:hypothetical protein